MPTKPLTPCAQPGCTVLVRGGCCAVHRRQTQRQAEQQRGSSTQRGYGARWQRASKAYLQAHPLCMCVHCDAGQIRVLAATVVDHIIAHHGNMTLFWDPSNWQAMSKPCHDRKTATEDGGFGRHPQPAIANASPIGGAPKCLQPEFFRPFVKHNFCVRGFWGGGYGGVGVAGSSLVVVRVGDGR